MTDQHNHSQNHSNTHGHDHHHSLAHAPLNFNRAFLIGIVLNFSFVVIETAYGFISNSLALLADAGHNLSDVLGLIIAWVAITLSKRKPDHQFTFGLKGSSILAALGNSVFLLVTIGAIIWKAVERFQNPTIINSKIVIAVALCGVVINGITAYLFHRGQKEDLNIKGAYLHMLADALVSVGVALVGVVYIFTEWAWLDPLVSIIVCLIIFKGSSHAHSVKI